MKINWMSFLALIFSIIALIITFLRIDVTISNDTFIGVIASFMGACATIIVGVQIYNSIENKKIKEDMQNMGKRMDDIFPVIGCAVNYIQGLANATERPLSAYRDFVYALNYAYNSNHHDVIEDCYNNLQAIIQKLTGSQKINENIEKKEIQIEKGINKLKQNSKYDDFAWRIEPIEKKRTKLFEKLKLIDNDNSDYKR